MRKALKTVLCVALVLALVMVLALVPAMAQAGSEQEDVTISKTAMAVEAW